MGDEKMPLINISPSDDEAWLSAECKNLILWRFDTSFIQENGGGGARVALRKVVIIGISV
jgi:hypothetical protein